MLLPRARARAGRFQASAGTCTCSLPRGSRRLVAGLQLEPDPRRAGGERQRRGVPAPVGRDVEAIDAQREEPPQRLDDPAFVDRFLAPVLPAPSTACDSSAPPASSQAIDVTAVGSNGKRRRSRNAPARDRELEQAAAHDADRALRAARA